MGRKIMNILYDISSAQTQGTIKINGGGEYALVVLYRLLEFAKENNSINITLACNKNYGECEKLNYFGAIFDFKIVYFHTNQELSKIINDNHFDKVVLPVCYSKYSDLRILPEIEIYTVIHDLCELYYPLLKVRYGRYVDKNFLIILKKRASKLIRSRTRYKKSLIAHKKVCSLSQKQHIITVTYYSKSTIEKYLNVDPSKINVFYTPEKKETIQMDNNFSSVIINYPLVAKKYFLLLAGSRWEKNNAIVLKVLDQMFSDEFLKSCLKDFKVILLGVNEKYKIYYQGFLHNIDRFIFEQYVDDKTLNALYRHAHLFVFPSCLEGFGMPPLEAMKEGTVPACSTAMSIPEVCGDAAIYFNPEDETSIELALLRSFDQEYMNQMILLGKKHYFSIRERRQTDLDNFVSFILE